MKPYSGDISWNDKKCKAHKRKLKKSVRQSVKKQLKASQILGGFFV